MLNLLTVYYYSKAYILPMVYYYMVKTEMKTEIKELKLSNAKIMGNLLDVLKKKTSDINGFFVNDHGKKMRVKKVNWKNLTIAFEVEL